MDELDTEQRTECEARRAGAERLAAHPTAAWSDYARAAMRTFMRTLRAPAPATCDEPHFVARAVTGSRVPQEPRLPPSHYPMSGPPLCINGQARLGYAGEPSPSTSRGSTATAPSLAHPGNVRRRRPSPEGDAHLRRQRPPPTSRRSRPSDQTTVLRGGRGSSGSAKPTRPSRSEGGWDLTESQAPCLPPTNQRR